MQKKIFQTGMAACCVLAAGYLGTALAEQEPAEDYGEFLEQVVRGEKGAAVLDGQGRPPVITAILYGSTEQLQEVLEAGFDPDATFSGVPALHFSVSESCHEGKLIRLIRAGAEPEAKDELLGATPFHLAAQHENTVCLEILARAGADIDAQDSQGRTAYFYAIDHQAGLAIEKLWSFGADTSIASNDGLDIFQYAIASDKAELVKPLIFQLVEQRFSDR